MSFYNAHNFTIGSARIGADRYYTTHYHGHPCRSQPDPTTILNHARAAEATHTSKTAEYAPKCKSGSRRKVIHDITNWVTTEEVAGDDDAPVASMLWFQGPAGGGKTCIMREVANRCQQLGLLAATYFFSDRVPGLDNEGPFVATFAHQLAADSPTLKLRMLQAISDRPDVFKESLHCQLETVVEDPLRSLFGDNDSNGAPSSLRRAIIVDGFDECRDRKERQNLLSLLRGLAMSTRSTPFLVIVASRPELDIRQTFELQDFASMTRVIRLQDYDGTSDIRNFFCDEFCRIRSTHPAKAVIPSNWPAETILDTIVDKSSGCYIYPATVIKYIDNPRRSPVVLLDEVMMLSKPGTLVNPLADLDALYKHILHPPDTDLILVRRLLHAILAINRMSQGACSGMAKLKVVISPSFLDQLLSLSSGQVVMGLCDLHSVIRVPQAPSSDSEDQSVQFFHKTMTDFLMDPRRAGDLHQPLFLIHMDLADACASQYKETSSRSDMVDKHVLGYSSLNWWRHTQLAFEDSPLVASRVLPDSIKMFNPLGAWKEQIKATRDPRDLAIHKRQEKIHRTLCKKSGACINLCANSVRLEAVDEAFKKFYDARVLRERENGTSWASQRALRHVQVPGDIFLYWFATFLKQELGDDSFLKELSMASKHSAPLPTVHDSPHPKRLRPTLTPKLARRKPHSQSSSIPSYELSCESGNRTAESQPRTFQFDFRFPIPSAAPNLPRSAEIPLQEVESQPSPPPSSSSVRESGGRDVA